MYRLEVIHPGDPRATEIVQISSSHEVLEVIPALLAKHAECERIAVFMDTTFLFAVDCTGKALPPR
jgi:hypothetical protein